MSENEMNDVAELQEDFRTGIRKMVSMVDLIEKDPSLAFGYRTWYGLALAHRAQECTAAVIAEGLAADRYLSMNGMLCGPRGEIQSVDWAEWPVLAERLHIDE